MQHQEVLTIVFVLAGFVIALAAASINQMSIDDMSSTFHMLRYSYDEKILQEFNHRAKFNTRAMFALLGISMVLILSGVGLSILVTFYS